MMKQLFLMLALMFSMTVSAQDAEALYNEGKALYGHKKAQYRVGRCYDKGHGVEENNQEAFKWYSKSAQQGYYKAEYQLARAYIKGKGVTADEKKARSWVKKAVGGKKHGAEMLEEIKNDAAAGDKTDKRLLELLGK